MVVKTKNRNKRSSRCVYVCVLSHVWPFVTPWTVARQAPLSVGFSREEYRRRLPYPSPGDLPNLGTEHSSPVLQADSLLLSHRGRPQTEMRPSSKVSSGKKGKTNLHFLPWTEWFFFLDLFLEWHKSNRLSKKIESHVQDETSSEAGGIRVSGSSIVEDRQFLLLGKYAYFPHLESRQNVKHRL